MRTIPRLIKSVLWWAAALAIGHPAAALAQDVRPASVRKAVLLTINDVYQIEGVANGRSGGMARVRALRVDLERTAPDLLLLHGGDFLSPSFLGRMFKGAQMVDLMNRMDGVVPGSFDPRMLVVFGNHEFDDTHCSRAGPLAQLVSDSEFTWLGANLDFAKCPGLNSLAGHPRIAANRIVESGGLKLGVFGITVSTPTYAAIVADPIATACQQVAELRSKGADVVVALTHLSYVDDLKLLGRGIDGLPLPAPERTCPDAPDVVIGGHDHNSMALPSSEPRLFKADAEAETAWVVEVSKSGGRVEVKGRLVKLDQRRREDADTVRVARKWLLDHDERFCREDCKGLDEAKSKACMAVAMGGACLKERYARSRSLIQTEEIVNRSYETGMGNWIADRMRQAGAADVAFLNSGSIRINYNLPAGTVLTRRHLEQMLPFKGKLVVRNVPGRDLWRAVEYAVERRGEGAWAHFSGMAVQLAAKGAPSRIARILVRRPDNSVVEIGRDSSTPIKVASISYVFSAHGFDLCEGQVPQSKCIASLDADPRWPIAGEEINDLVRTSLKAIPPKRGLRLAIDRRLCERDEARCLISRWRVTASRAP